MNPTNPYDTIQQLRQRVTELEKERDDLLAANKIMAGDLIERHDRVAALRFRIKEALHVLEKRLSHHRKRPIAEIGLWEVKYVITLLKTASEA